MALVCRPVSWQVHIVCGVAVPTIYRGIRYRSRLEAKWAAMFDRLGWQHRYEPVDGDRYIPDFLIEGERPLLVEIKPATMLDEYRDPVPKAERGLREHWKHDVLILGMSPLPTQLDGTAAADATFHPPAGWLGELSDDCSGWSWDTGVWFSCKECGEVGVYQQMQSWEGRPCGHYDGDHLLGRINPSLLDDHWAFACNETQWNPPGQP